MRNSSLKRNTALNGKVDNDGALDQLYMASEHTLCGRICRIVDNLPGATAKTEVSEGGRKMYVAGFPLGRIKVTVWKIALYDRPPFV
jgi:hypothetical protein